MYIAIIADNIAARKHMERLLDRTSDAIMSRTGNLYIEAYGDPESMWPLYKRYDMFFLDITQDPALKEQLIARFTQLELTNQTVICQPEGEAYSFWPAEHGFLSVQHPLTIPVLSRIVSDTYQIAKQKQASLRTIEFRKKEDTEYILVDQILYAMENEHLVDVHLLDGSVQNMLGNLFDFYRLVENFPEFEMHNNEIVVNNTHVTKIQGKTITFSNRQTVRLSLIRKHLFLK